MRMKLNVNDVGHVEWQAVNQKLDMKPHRGGKYAEDKVWGTVAMRGPWVVGAVTRELHACPTHGQL